MRSSSMSTVRKLESVCTCTPGDPTVSALVYLFIRSWHGQSRNADEPSSPTPRLAASFAATSRASVCVFSAAYALMVVLRAHQILTAARNAAWRAY
jgi:hypothetical protein